MIVFVTGKTGSGKSKLAKLLASKLNCTYIDVDSIGHTLYADPQIMAQLNEIFGKEILDENGDFDRKRLGQIFFGEKKSERVKRFSEITWQKMEQVLDSEIKGDVVVDWVLLPETKFWQMPATRILVKAQDDEKRLNGIVARDKVSYDYAKLRDSSGLDYVDSEMDFVFENDYNGDSLHNFVGKVVDFVNSAINLKVLGSQSPYAKENNACPSFLLSDNKKNLLLDCGSGSHRFFDMTNLNNLGIVISHLHRDHYNDLFNYMYSAFVMKNQGKLKNPISIFVPNQPENIYKDIRNEKLTFSVVNEINESKSYNFCGCKIEFLRVVHSLDLPSFAIKISAKGKVIVYTGDCSYQSKDDIIKFCKNADVLICESSLLKSYGFPEICNHLTALQSGTIAKCANVKKLILCHFWPEEDTDNYLNEAKSVFCNVFVAKEKDEYLI